MSPMLHNDNRKVKLPKNYLIANVLRKGDTDTIIARMAESALAYSRLISNGNSKGGIKRLIWSGEFDQLLKAAYPRANLNKLARVKDAWSTDNTNTMTKIVLKGGITEQDALLYNSNVTAEIYNMLSKYGKTEYIREKATSLLDAKLRRNES